MDSQKLLQIQNLSKSYGEAPALDRFSLDMERGEVLGLLGPNGAGKTTLISILSGTLPGFSGSVTFQGKNLFSDRSLKNRLGIVPQDMAFYEELSAMDNLLFWGGLYDISRSELKRRAEELLKSVELSDRAKEPVKSFSGGMKRRLHVAIAPLRSPDLLLLDEPTVGIDVQAKVSILEIIKRVGREGTAVIFTTHQLAEVEETCSRIAIMDHGRILAQGTLDELIKTIGEKVIVRVEGEFSLSSFSEAIGSLADDGVELISAADDIVSLGVDDTDRIPKVMERLFSNNVQISDLKIHSPNLETVFLRFTGKSLRD